ncbi:ubiquitin-hydrolase Zn-finger-containing protein [Catalinimonas alkaloidigena]|uniref:Ubiquitin-hydrolase Zn-finger-containing protein n=1 Tax=Catalinimonas alkaloidigena TaxID=1075417 RepID=A0A1G9GPU1_9BACT|nr:UBP-type zinc finger domain-containing protein [Catalinimonas alkaloidigena]SDL02622.1 ubiquitin-hydrolase Zn-finger-containing protein [Catalinimonas alkaloidigena]
MSLTPKPCAHLQAVGDLKQPRAHACDECVKTGSRWVHLRTCQTCGTTLCCDSSPNQHASKHARTMDHPVVISAEPGERWLWCYPDEQFARY